MRRGDDAAEWDEVEQLLRRAARQPGPVAEAEAGPAKAAAALGVQVAGRLEVKLES